MMKPNEIEALELELLIEAILKRYGHDFRHYARASLSRRLAQFLVKAESERDISGEAHGCESYKGRPR